MKSLVLGRQLLFLTKSYFRTSVRTLNLESHAEGNHSAISQTDVLHNKDKGYSVESSEPSSLRRIPLTAQDFKSRHRLMPVQPENPHLLKVAIVGEPNVGKSTLVNSLVRWKVCSVSKKVHTTREKAAGILIEDNKQVVFLDTPGLVSLEHGKRHHLEASLIVDPEHSALSADLVAVVIDASNKFSRKAISDSILEMLEECKAKTSILVLNKVDRVKLKSDLLRVTTCLTNRDSFGNEINLSTKDSLPEKTEISPHSSHNVDEPVQKGWSNFSEVFMISALDGLGVDELREYMFSIAKPSPWLHHYSTVTDQHPYELAKQIVRGKLLNFLPHEIPYNLKYDIVSWTVDDCGILRINIMILCPNQRHVSYVIGPSGSAISKCVKKCRQALSDAFRCEVFLKLSVDLAD